MKFRSLLGIAVALLLGAGLCSASAREVRPAAVLLGTQPPSGDTAFLKEQLRVLRVIRPRLENHRLHLPVTFAEAAAQEIPESYYRYGEEFVRLFNDFAEETEQQWGLRLLPDSLTALNYPPDYLTFLTLVQWDGKNGRYSLPLSQAEILSLGVAEESYQEMITQMEEANALFEEWIQNGEYTLKEEKPVPIPAFGIKAFPWPIEVPEEGFWNVGIDPSRIVAEFERRVGELDARYNP